MTEAIFQSLLTKYLKANAVNSAAYELKLVKGKSLPFSAVKEHQVNALLKARHGRIVHKISDLGMGLKPFDCFSLYHSLAFVGVMYHKPHSRHRCCLIDIDMWVKEMGQSKRRSLTEERAKEIGIIIEL